MNNVTLLGCVHVIANITFLNVTSLPQSTDTSPASSLHSLPISPCSEKSLPLKVMFFQITSARLNHKGYLSRPCCIIYL